jgi:YggT family protein
MRTLFFFIDLGLEIYIWLLVATAVLSWLIEFNVVSTGNRAVTIIGGFLHQATEPSLRPIRRFLPKVGTIDASVIVMILIVFSVRYLIALYVVPRLI